MIKSNGNTTEYIEIVLKEIYDIMISLSFWKILQNIENCQPINISLKSQKMSRKHLINCIKENLAGPI